jgi:hypothetical protein
MNKVEEQKSSNSKNFKKLLKRFEPIRSFLNYSNNMMHIRISRKIIIYSTTGRYIKTEFNSIPRIPDEFNDLLKNKRFSLQICT